MNYIKEEFEKWVYNVCDIIAQRSRKDVHEIYQILDLTEARLNYMDGISVEDYSSTFQVTNYINQ